MGTQVQHRRGTTAQHASFTGAVGEVTVDTDKKTLIVHDGSVAGGFVIERAKNAVLLVSAPTGDAITTGDGKAYFRVPSALDGWKITAVAASLYTASTSGAVTVQIRNKTDVVDVLSVPITIDQDELDSLTAATPPTINASNNTVGTGDQIAVDIDGAGTGAKGLVVALTFTKLA